MFSSRAALRIPGWRRVLKKFLAVWHHKKKFKTSKGMVPCASVQKQDLSPFFGGVCSLQSAELVAFLFKAWLWLFCAWALLPFVKGRTNITRVPGVTNLDVDLLVCNQIK